MIRRSPDLILLVVVITMVGAIATSIAHGAQSVNREHNKTYLQPSTQKVNSAYFDAFINYNPYLVIHQGADFDLHMGEVNLKMPLYKALNANDLEHTGSYSFFGLKLVDK